MNSPIVNSPLGYSTNRGGPWFLLCFEIKTWQNLGSELRCIVIAAQQNDGFRIRGRRPRLVTNPFDAVDGFFIIMKDIN